MDKELNLKELLVALKKKIALILIVTVLFGVAAYTYLFLTTVNTYSSISRIICSSTAESTGTLGQSAIAASSLMSKTVRELILTEPFMAQVAEKINSESGYVGITASKIGSMLTVTQLEDTYILVIRATDKDPKLARIVAHTVADLASEDNGTGIIATLNGGKISRYGEVKESSVPNDPKLGIKSLLAAVIGFILVTLIVILKFLSDDKVRGQQDILSRYNVPLLGVIPPRYDK